MFLVQYSWHYRCQRSYVPLPPYMLHAYPLTQPPIWFYSMPKIGVCALFHLAAPQSTTSIVYGRMVNSSL